METDKSDEPEPGPTIVGLGASAGGLQALKAFFEPMPKDSGLVFVVVTHQHPDHVSLMPELIGKHTALTVVEASDGMAVEPDHVYLSRPGSKLALMGGVLHEMQSDVETAPSHRALPIDYFFRSLAKEARERAIAIVLSGTGSDGSVGAKIIKRESGLVMAEDPKSASYDGMPGSVIATGLVDFIDTPAELGRKAVAYAKRGGSARVPTEGAEVPLQELRKALVVVRDHTGHDFSSYKENTVRRRIERRMNLHQIDTPTDYVRHLLRNPLEVETLFKELLIGVTHFFRDPEAFRALAEHIPRIVEGKLDGESVRIWVPGCSTGEEAYSIAMLLREATGGLSQRVTVQLFATDLDAAAIEVARAGVYPEGIAVDVGEARLGGSSYATVAPTGCARRSATWWCSRPRT